MNALLILVARTLVEHSTDHPQSDCAAACDVALQFLKSRGISAGGLRELRAAVRRELSRRQRLSSAVLRTPQGSSGAAHKGIHSTLEQTLGTCVNLEEHADASLLGGALLSIGDERLDVSLRGSLQHLHRHVAA